MQEDNILVSVIVPVYNVEDYVKRMIESLLLQDYDSFEIIMVDDGSTDRSGKIIDDFALKDGRIRAIHGRNHGVSFARNQGLHIAKGKYILFVDADDYVESDYISSMVMLIEKYGTDVAISTDHFEQKKTKVEIQEPPCDRILDNETVICDIYLNKIYMAVWNKIYRTDFLKKYKIEFDETIWYAEGMLFNIRCLSKTKSVAITNRKTYHYVSNPESAMRKGFSVRNQECALRSLEFQKSFITGLSTSVEDARQFHKIFIIRMILAYLYGEASNNKMIEKKTHEYEEIMKGFRREVMENQFFGNDRLKWLIVCFCPKIIGLKRMLSNN